MPNKHKHLIILIILLIPFYAQAQQSKNNHKKDTVFVYETITVYDTIIVYQPATNAGKQKLEALEIKGSDFKILQLDTLTKKANLLLISNNKTATIPLNGIILNENIKNSNSMKKLTFFGVMLFAFQSMVMAQSEHKLNYGVTVGGGAWWTRGSNYSTPSKDQISKTISVGIFANYPLSSFISLQTELNYSSLRFNPDAYNAVIGNYSYSDSWSTDFGNYSDSWEYPLYLDLENSKTDYTQFAIPIKFFYTKYKLKPYIGFEYSIRYPQAKYTIKVKNVESMGLTIGANYPVWKQLSVSLDYYHGLTNDVTYHDIKGVIKNPYGYSGDFIHNGGTFSWKYSRLELSLHYSFGQGQGKPKTDPM